MDELSWPEMAGKVFLFGCFLFSFERRGACIILPYSEKSLSLWKLGVGFVVLMIGAGGTLAQAEKGPDHSDLKSDHANYP